MGFESRIALVVIGLLFVAWARRRGMRESSATSSSDFENGSALGTGLLFVLGVLFIALAVAWWLIESLIRGGA